MNQEKTLHVDCTNYASCDSALQDLQETQVYDVHI